MKENVWGKEMWEEKRKDICIQAPQTHIKYIYIYIVIITKLYKEHSDG